MLRPRAIMLCALFLGSPVAAAPADHAAVIAQRYVGVPYHYGGATPAGFDCSGLVHFAYMQAGIQVPRTVTTQLASAKPIQLGQLRPGDLLFFLLRDGRRQHVGIYLGNGRFIHAPSRGKQVEYATLSSPFWKSHVIGAGRIVTAR